MTGGWDLVMRVGDGWDLVMRMGDRMRACVCVSSVHPRCSEASAMCGPHEGLR